MGDAAQSTAGLFEAFRELREAAADRSALLQVLVRLTARALDAYSVAFVLSDDHVWLNPVAEFDGTGAASASDARAFGAVPMSANLPIVECVRTGRGVHVSEPKRVAAAEALLTSQRRALDALDVTAVEHIPLVARGAALGVVTSCRRAGQPTHFDGAAVELVQALADMAARLFDYGRLAERERALGRQLEEALKARRRAETILEALPDALLLTDRDGVVTQVNARTERLFGHPRGELLGRSIATLSPAMELAAPGEHEVVARSKDGGELAVEVGFVEVEVDGQAVHARVLRDVSDRRRTENRFRALVDASPDATVVVDRYGALVLVNAQTETLFGYSRADLLQKPVEILIPERFRAKHPGHRSGFFAEPRVRAMGSAIELYALRSDGAEFPVEISLSPIEIDGERLVAAAIRDVSARRRAEEKFRGLLESAPDSMVIVDTTGRILLINAQTEKLFGFTRGELIGQWVELLMPDRFRRVHTGHRGNYFSAPRPRGMGAGFELYGRRKDGSEFPIEISLSPIQTDEGVLVAAAIRDITDRKALEQKTQEASRLKSEFLANMSHELRTPLNAIIGFSELMHRGKVGPVSPQHQEYLGDILTSSRHLLQLINDVLDLSKVEAGKMELRPERVAVSRVFFEVRDILRGLAAQKRITVEIEVVPPLGDVVLDPARLKQILYNYLSNAIKFTPDDGTVRVRAARTDEQWFRVDVEDTGVGISATDLRKLFVEFQQLDASAAKRFQGTGLGLALTKRITEAMGGRVEVRSELGGGSVFSAILPLALAGPAS